jgi:cytochrome bd-type quinol oxidase subunit 2
MSLSRVALLTLVVAPVNLWIVSRVTGYRAWELFRLLPVPLLAGLAAVGATAGLRALGLLDDLGRVPALLLSGGVAFGAAAGVLVLLEPNIRPLARSLWRARSRREAAADPAWQAPLPSD